MAYFIWLSYNRHNTCIILWYVISERQSKRELSNVVQQSYITFLNVVLEL